MHASRRLFLASPLLFAGTSRANDAAWALLVRGGHFVFIRHAVTTPGVGDPENFNVADCSTQRNLSDAGRAEARRLGEMLRSRAVPVAAVLSSPWCRCIDTARIATGREPQLQPALSNLFGRPENRDVQLAQLRALTARAPAGGNVLLFTHGSTTLAFTGVSPATGEMVMVSPQAGSVKVVGRITVA